LFTKIIYALEPRNHSTYGDEKIKSEVIYAGDCRFYLDLKENARGRFLKVTPFFRFHDNCVCLLSALLMQLTDYEVALCLLCMHACAWVFDFGSGESQHHSGIRNRPCLILGHGSGPVVWDGRQPNLQIRWRHLPRSTGCQFSIATGGDQTHRTLGY